MKGIPIIKPLLLFSLVGLLLIISGQSTFAIERDKYLYFTDVEGLPRNIVTCIEQDKYGYTWIGTGNGISRFNGKEFKNYDLFKGQTINQLLIDSNNGLWMISNQGLYFYNRTKDLFEMKYEGYVNTVREYLGEIYFANFNNIMKFNSSGITDVITDNNIQSFCITHEGFWLGKNSDGVKFIGHNNINRTNTTGLEAKSVSVVREIDGTIFLGCRNGELFVRKANGNKLKIAIKNHHAIKEIKKVNNEIWLATDGNGVIILDEKLNYARSLRRENRKNPKFKSNSIYDVYLGQDNEVWIATYGAGLICLVGENSPFENIIPEPGNRNSLVAKEGVLAFKKGSKIYLGTNYGLSVLEENKGVFSNILPNRLQAELRGTKVLAINTDEQNNFWLGTYDGLLGKYTSDLQFIRSYQPCGDNATDMQRIIFIYKCKGNNFLIATHYRNRNLLNFNINAETFTPLSVSIGGTSTTNFQIMSIRENREGETLSVLRYDGLYTVNREKNILENNLPEINKRITFALNDFYSDTKGYYWLATQAQGLVRMSEDGREFDKWTTEQGLPTNTLLRIESTDDEFLWISTIAGLCRFEMETGSVLIFNHEHGLPVNEFTARASTITDDGRLIFGSNAGFTIVNPRNVQPDTSKTHVIISDITFHNQSIKELTDKPILNQPLEETKEIHIPFKRNSFTLHFFSKDKNLPKYNNYAYRLQGLEDEWIYLGETNHTTYTNLSPGKYTFEVKSTNKGNVWSSSPTQLAIRINPPWYLSWYAIVAYAFFIIGNILGAMYFYAYRVKLKKEVEISEYKAQKEHELTEKKIAFFTNISHDLKTPLTLIDAPLSDLLSSAGISEKQKNKLEVIQRNSGRLYKLITDLLDFRKLTQKQLQLKVSETNVDLAIENTYQAFKEKCTNKHLEFERSAGVKKLVFVDEKKVEKILWNLLSNAVEYTDNDGVVFFSAEEIEQNGNLFLKIVVKDTGRGIPKEAQHKIFNRFYQHQETKRNLTEGTGIGLSIVNELVHLHHGSVSVNSDPGYGSTFTVLLPSEKKAYKENEIVLTKSKTKLFNSPHKISRNKETDSEKQNRYNLSSLLLVEDSKELREYLVGFFETRYKVYQAEDGVQGLKVVKEKYPDIVVTDILMPNMNGYEFCKLIRNSFDTSHIPVVMLTANSETEQEIEGLSFGADAYVTKPFDINLLDTLLRSILANRKKIRNRFIGINHPDENEHKLNPKDVDFINELKSVIDANLANQKLNVNFLSEHFSISRTKLNKKIKSLVGQTPNNLVKTVRLKKAHELIKEQGMRVSEAAYMTGFSDPNYFTICFKKEFGENPSKVNQ